jgi:hypothetical protein
VVKGLEGLGSRHPSLVTETFQSASKKDALNFLKILQFDP